MLRGFPCTSREWERERRLWSPTLKEEKGRAIILRAPHFEYTGNNSGKDV
jgi:hypothetical protein